MKKTENKHKKLRIVLICFLIVLSCGITIFFHIVLKRGTVVTHLYYIPIILATLWLRKSIFIPISLSAFLIISHIFLRSDVEIQNDLLRSCMFILVYFIFAKLKEKFESSEKELQVTKTKLNQIFNLSKDAIITIGNDMNIKRINLTANKLLGLSKGAVIEEDNNIFFDSTSFYDSIKKIMQKIIAGETYIEMETLINNKITQKKLPCIVTATPLWGMEGTITGLVMAMKDITARKRYHKKLQKYQKKLQSLSSELTLAEERERRRIANYLHDQIGHNLALTMNKINALQQEISDRDGTVEQVNDIEQFMKSAINNVRSLTFKISPPLLYEFGLCSALKWLIEQYNHESGITCDFRCNEIECSLEKDISVLLFKIINELFLNVIKHAQTKNILLHLEEKKKYVYITFSDNGVGFDTSNLENIMIKKGGFGLFSIRERIKYLGGHFKIESSINNGTCIKISVPKNNRE